METSFARNLASLDQVFEVISTFVADHGLDASAAFSVRLAVEELFVNMVRYNPASTGRIGLRLSAEEDRVTVSLSDSGAEPFDITTFPEYDASLSLEERRPGGLGIHLARRMMDSVTYKYDSGTSTITLVKMLGGAHV